MLRHEITFTSNNIKIIIPLMILALGNGITKKIYNFFNNENSFSFIKENTMSPYNHENLATFMQE